jgi:hypothetical protein
MVFMSLLVSVHALHFGSVRSFGRLPIPGEHVLVADGGGEEFQKAARRMLACAGDEGRHNRARAGGRHGSGFGCHKRL